MMKFLSIRHLAPAALLLAAFSQYSAAQVGSVASGTGAGQYNPLTGELVVSVNSIVNFYVESASSGITPLAPPPSNGPAGALLTNNVSRIGFTGLQAFSLTDYSFGSIGQGLPEGDLSMVYNARLGGARVTVPINYYVPEPAAAGLLGLGLLGLCTARRRR